jgi:hypothetical protein
LKSFKPFGKRNVKIRVLIFRKKKSSFSWEIIHYKLMFKKKESTSSFETIFKLTIVILAIAIVFFLPFYWYYKYQGQGIAMYLVLIVFTSPFIKHTFKDFIYFKKNEISNAFLTLHLHILIQ